MRGPMWPRAARRLRPVLSLSLILLLLPLLHVAAQGTAGSSSSPSSSLSSPSTGQVFVAGSFNELVAAATTIQAAWASGDSNVSSTVTIRLLEGNFNMGTAISFSTGPPSCGALHIEGAGSASTILDCSSSTAAAAGIRVTTELNLTISGVQFRACSPGLEVQLAVGRESSAGPPLAVSLDACTFVSCRKGGATIMHLPTLSVTRCAWANNTSPDATGCVGAATFLNIGSIYLASTTFEANSCNGMAGVGALYIADAKSISIDNCSFMHNSGMGVYAFRGGAAIERYSTLTMAGTSFVNNSSPSLAGRGAMEIIEGRTCSISNCSFIDNSAPGAYSLGGLNLYNFETAYVSDSTFIRNSCKDGANGFGGLLCLSYLAGSLVEIFNSTFIGNTAQGYAGIPAFLVGGMSKARLTRVHCKGNLADKDLGRGGGVLYGISFVIVNESTFEDNRGSCDPNNVRTMHSGASSSLLPTVDFFKCGGGALFIYQSQAVIVSSMFRNNSGNTLWFAGGAVLAHSVSAMHILNSTFVENVAAAGGAVAGIANTFVMVDLPLFADYYGNGGIGCNNDPFFNLLIGTWPELWDVFLPTTVWGSSFIGNQAVAGGAIATLESVLSISFMPQLKCTVPTSQQVLFSGNRALSGGAITSVRPPGGFFIMHADFVNNSALAYTQLSPGMFHGDVNSMEISAGFALSWGCGIGNGGAVCFATTGTFKGSNQAIAASTFSNNTATFGGALYITADQHDCPDPDTCNLIAVTGLQQCNPVFQALFMPGPGHVMLPYTEVNMSGNTADGGAGGGVYLEHTSIMHVNCGYDTNVPLNFSTASACFEDSPFNFSFAPCPAWKDNSAINGAFGDVIASSPINFTVELPQPDQLSSYTSGDLMPLQFKIFDLFGQEHVVAVQNTAQAADVLFNVVAIAGNETDGQMTVQATPGRLPSEVSVMTFQSKPGSVKLTVKASLSRLKRTLPQAVLAIAVRKCRIGEFMAKGGKLCLSCDVGRYNLDPNGAECAVCPAEATCTTSTTPEARNPIILPGKQNFHSNPFSTQITQCPNPKACDYDGREAALLEFQYLLIQRDPYDPRAHLEFNATEYQGLLCSDGYIGPACALCEKGYGLTRVGQCVKCNDSYGVDGFFLFLVNVVAFLPLLWSMRAAMQNLVKWSPMGSAKVYMSRVRQQLVTEAACMKTIVSYLQVIGMFKWIYISNSAVTQLNTDVNILSAAQKLADNIMYATSNLVSMSCTRSSAVGVDMTVFSVIISFVIPVCSCVALILIWGFMSFWEALYYYLASFSGGPNQTGQSLANPDSFAIKARTEMSFLKRAASARQHRLLEAAARMRPVASSKGTLTSAAPPTLAQAVIKDPLFSHLPICRVDLTQALSFSTMGDVSASATARVANQPPNMASCSLSSFLAQADVTPRKLDGGPGSSFITQLEVPGSKLSGFDPFSSNTITVADAFTSSPPSRVGAAPNPAHQMDEDTRLDLGLPPGMMVDPALLPATHVSNIGAVPDAILEMDEDTRLELGMPPGTMMDPALLPPTHGQRFPLINTSRMSGVVGSISGHADTQDHDTRLELGLDTGASPGVAKAVVSAKAAKAAVSAPKGRSKLQVTSSLPSGGTQQVAPMHLFNLHEFSSASIVAFIISTFYYYPTIVQQTILIFICSTVDTSEDTSLAQQYGLHLGSRWIMNFGMDCYQGEHLFLVYFLGIPGILFSVGLPTFWVFWLMRNRERMDQADFKARYSFMYEDYKSEYYFWGCFEMLNKLALMAILVLLSAHTIPPGLQLNSALTVATSFMLGHILLQPHFSKLIHRLSLLAELCIVFTLQYCLYFTYPTVPKGYAVIGFFLGVVNILSVATIFLFWCHLVIENMVMRAGLDSSILHTLSSQTVVEFMWPQNNFKSWKRKLLQVLIATPILLFYKVAHWVRSSLKCAFHKLKRTVDKGLHRNKDPQQF